MRPTDIPSVPDHEPFATAPFLKGSRTEEVAHISKRSETTTQLSRPLTPDEKARLEHLSRLLFFFVAAPAFWQDQDPESQDDHESQSLSHLFPFVLVPFCCSTDCGRSRRHSPIRDDSAFGVEALPGSDGQVRLLRPLGWPVSYHRARYRSRLGVPVSSRPRYLNPSICALRLPTIGPVQLSFEAFGRPVKSTKLTCFEEGVYTDLQMLRNGTAAHLEEAEVGHGSTDSFILN
jgi:hypothetical protein